MKTYPRSLLFVAALAPAALLLTSSCSKTDDSSKNIQEAKADASKAVAEVKAAAVNTWDSIKDFTYDRRADFCAGIDRLAKDLDDKAAVVKAKLAGVPDATAKERAEALKEYDEARADLKVKLTELGNATSDTWADAKAKASEAWKRVQGAYDRVTKANAAP